jgi:hypothetical protein
VSVPTGVCFGELVSGRGYILDATVKVQKRQYCYTKMSSGDTHQVLRLEVAVHDAVAVQVRAAQAQLVHEVLHDALGQWVGRPAPRQIHVLLQVLVQVLEHLHRGGATRGWGEVCQWRGAAWRGVA